MGEFGNTSEKNKYNAAIENINSDLFNLNLICENPKNRFIGKDLHGRLVSKIDADANNLFEAPNLLKSSIEHLIKDIKYLNYAIHGVRDKEILKNTNEVLDKIKMNIVEISKVKGLLAADKNLLNEVLKTENIATAQLVPLVDRTIGKIQKLISGEEVAESDELEDKDNPLFTDMFEDILIEMHHQPDSKDWINKYKELIKLDNLDQMSSTQAFKLVSFIAGHREFNAFINKLPNSLNLYAKLLVDNDSLSSLLSKIDFLPQLSREEQLAAKAYLIQKKITDNENITKLGIPDNDLIEMSKYFYSLSFNGMFDNAELGEKIISNAENLLFLSISDSVFEHLPSLPKCNDIMCTNTKFKSIGELPSCRKVVLDYNYSLEKFPATPLCIIFGGSNCPKINQAPELPLAKYIRLSNTNIAEIRTYPSSDRLICNGCPQLKKIEKQPAHTIECQNCPELEELTISENNLHVDIRDSQNITDFKGVYNKKLKIVFNQTSVKRLRDAFVNIRKNTVNLYYKFTMDSPGLTINRDGYLTAFEGEGIKISNDNQLAESLIGQIKDTFDYFNSVLQETELNEEIVNVVNTWIESLKKQITDLSKLDFPDHVSEYKDKVIGAYNAVIPKTLENYFQLISGEKSPSQPTDIDNPFYESMILESEFIQDREQSLQWYQTYGSLLNDSALDVMSTHQSFRLIASLLKNQRNFPNTIYQHLNKLSGKYKTFAAFYVSNDRSMLGELSNKEAYYAKAAFVEVKGVMEALNTLYEGEILQVGHLLNNLNLEYVNSPEFEIELIKKAAPNVKSVQLASLIDELPEFPKCKVLTILDAPYLTKIDKQPKCEKFSVRYCPGLTELPEMPELRELALEYTGITSISNLSKCLLVWLDHNNNLESIDHLTACEILHIYNCPNVLSVDNSFHVSTLFAHNCEILNFVNSLPECDTLNIQDCPILTTLPEVPRDADVQIDAHKPKQWVIEFDKFQEKPLELLLTLYRDYLSVNKPLPLFYYEKDGESFEAIDAGGVRRDFMARLAENLFDYSNQQSPNHLPHFNGDPVLDDKPETIEAYKALAHMFLLCLKEGKSSSDIRLGPLFVNKELYNMISTLNPDNITDDWYLNAYIQLMKDDLKVSPDKLIDLMNLDYKNKKPEEVKTPEFTPEEYMFLTYFIDSTGETTVDAEFLKIEENRNNLKSELIESAKSYNKIKVIKIIAQEMKDSLGEQEWNKINNLQPGELQERIEGEMTTKALISKLRFSGTSNEKTKGFLLNWIGSLDTTKKPGEEETEETKELNKKKSETLVRFIRAVTGNSGLGSSPLTILMIDLKKLDKSLKSLPISHTCFFRLDLPINYDTQEVFNEKIEKFIEYALAGKSFSDE